MLIRNQIDITFIAGEDDEAQQVFLNSNDISKWNVSTSTMGTTYTYNKIVFTSQKGKTYDVKS